MRRIIGIAVFALAFIGATTLAAPPQQSNPFQLFILEARTDLERLANEVMGEGNRTQIPSWTFNTDLDSETVVIDLWFDNEQLADQIFGLGQRPVEWFGATTNDQQLLARNARHDLELSADEVFGAGQRPAEWNGATAIYRCDRTIQNLVRLLGDIYNARPNTPESVLNYCLALSNEIESELIRVVFEAASESALPDLSLALRGDLERLANELLGVNERPSIWVGNVEEGSPSLVADAAADLETLADLELGNGQRPEGWTNLTSSPLQGYRNIRFNLELLADVSLGEDVRPNGWQGANPIERCDPNQQGLILIMERNFGFVIDDTLAESENFCELTTFTANSIAENPPEPEVIPGSDEDLRFVGESELAFTYLDQAATKYMGAMPYGTEFRAWYRNFNESTMMFVSGQDFALYIDRRWTTLPEETFVQLPTLEGVRPLTFCDANWCNGPGPTPTPTGGGPLLALVNAQTPPAQVSASEIGQLEGKTEVSWNNIRVTYLLDRADTGTVQVALEICAEPQQIACEAVINVFDNLTGTNKPVISQFNGLNVYEFRYGFNDQVVVEGSTRVANAIFLSDPTIR
jgi:hypothetical protein